MVNIINNNYNRNNTFLLINNFMLSNLFKEQFNSPSLSKRLLKQQRQMLNFLFQSDYDIIYHNVENKQPSYLEKNYLRHNDINSNIVQEMVRFYTQISQKLHARILRDDIQLDRELYRLQLLWEHKHIPLFHRYYFEKYISTAYFKYIHSLVLNQEKLIRDQNHIYYNIIQMVSTRQACLQSLKQIISQINKADIFEYIHLTKQQKYYQERKLETSKYERQGYKDIKQNIEQEQPMVWKTKLQIFADNFQHYKKLTFYVIDMIEKWKQYIFSLTHNSKKQRQRVAFYYNNQNYNLKILTDLEFLRKTPLSSFYEFSLRNDPFLIKCILNIQKKNDITIEDQLLKTLIFPTEEQYDEIFKKLQILARQYEFNIQRRRLYNISSKRANSISSTRNYPSRTKQILINFKSSSLSKLKTEKAQVNIKTAEETNNFNFSKGISEDVFGLPLKLSNSKIIDQKLTTLNSNMLGNSNAQNDNYNYFKRVQSNASSNIKKYTVKKNIITDSFKFQQDKNLNEQALTKLKQSIVKKIKQDVQIPKNRFKITQKYSQNYEQHEQENLKSTLQLITKSFKEQYIQKQIKKIYQNYPVQYLKIQIPLQELQILISKILYCSIIEGTINSQRIGYIFWSLDFSSTDIKRIKVLHILTYDINKLSDFIEKAVEFLWKYQTAYEIEFTFYMETENKKTVKFLQALNEKVETQCLIVTKLLYNHFQEIRYLYTRKTKNIKYIPNKYPLKLYIGLKAILSNQQLENKNPFTQLQIQTSAYQYMLAELMHRYSNQDDLIILRERCNWKEKLKKILDVILSIDKKDFNYPEILAIQSTNIEQLNIKLKQKKLKYLDLNDKRKNNKVYYIQTEMLFELPYILQYARINNRPYYKIKIEQKIQVIKSPKITAYILNSVNKLQKILYMDAKHYCESNQNLFRYIINITQTNVTREVYISNLFIPMIKIPKQYNQRNQTYTRTKLLPQFNVLHKQIYYNEEVEFFANFDLQNGIDVSILPKDIQITQAYIMCIVSNNIPIWAKFII